MHGRGERVVRRLTHADVVIGMDRMPGAELSSQHVRGAVGDDLVGVHVRLGARSRLPDVQRELRVEIPRDDLVGSGDEVMQV